MKDINNRLIHVENTNWSIKDIKDRLIHIEKTSWFIKNINERLIHKEKTKYNKIFFQSLSLQKVGSVSEMAKP